MIPRVIFHPVHPLYVHPANYCFGSLLQKDPDSVAESSNTYRIQLSGRNTVPARDDVTDD